MSSNMFAGLAVEEEFDAELSAIAKNVELTIDEQGFLCCEGRGCSVMTPVFCECEGACYVGLPDALAVPVETEPAAPAEPDALSTKVRRFMIFEAYNPAIGGHLMAEARKQFPNPEGSEFQCPFTVTLAPHVGGYIIAAYAATVAAADELLSKFTTSVELYVAHRETYINVTNVKPEILDGFFREKNFRKLGPYTFRLIESEEGVFIQIGREKVGMLAFRQAEQEFWNIYNFLNLLNGTVNDVHILHVLRKISPEIDAAMEDRKAAFNKQNHGERGTAFSADGHKARPATLADFFAHFEIAPAKGGKKGKKN